MPADRLPHAPVENCARPCSFLCNTLFYKELQADIMFPDDGEYSPIGSDTGHLYRIEPHRQVKFLRLIVRPGVCHVLTEKSAPVGVDNVVVAFAVYDLASGTRPVRVRYILVLAVGEFRKITARSCIRRSISSVINRLVLRY